MAGVLPENENMVVHAVVEGEQPKLVGRPVISNTPLLAVTDIVRLDNAPQVTGLPNLSATAIVMLLRSVDAPLYPDGYVAVVVPVVLEFVS